MSLETLNLGLFHVINGAQDASQFIIRLAIFFANDLLYILLFILTFLWFYGDQDLKNRVIKSVF
ncbi:undecaprenyl-pyrophosphatase YbjG, partial [Acinetobacter baumannii]